MVVGIGASAGGLDAFRGFFEHMPADAGMAFVVILHLPADRPSLLPEILSRWTAMRIVRADEATPIEPNCVYVPPPHAHVSHKDGHLEVSMPRVDERPGLRPIDAFFDSLASSLRDRAVGIVLSGTGSDGSLGLKAIKKAGGLTIAQGTDGTAPQYGEMPAGAIATGAVDVVASVEAIPSYLVRIRRLERQQPVPAAPLTSSTDAARRRICAILCTAVGHDFSGYREATFLRRVARRMHVLNVATLDDYIAHLETHHEETLALFRDLLIRVTSFFRNPETFSLLETSVIPRLFAGKGANSAVRVWVPGCATGEEAYSLAILLREHMDTLEAVPQVQLFATDIDESGISIARAGRYPTTLLNGLSEARRQRFFTLAQGSFLVTKDIRDLCTFSTHNLIRDPPFSRMDLVSCRNLLIYMNLDLQGAVIPAFHYSLIANGILLLGGSEGTAKHEHLFSTLDKAARIFIKRDVRTPPLRLDTLTVDSAVSGAATDDRATHSLTQPQPGASGAAGESGRSRARTAGEPQTAGNRPDELPNRLEHLLNTMPANPPGADTVTRELTDLRDQFQSLTEEHQTALEELRSANEELHSVNEELQSTNEELETSKEELQSLNEEMHTVNLRLTEKNEELDAANSDLKNLFESTDIASIFLDRHLLIRGFTPAIAAIYNLVSSDQGRPLTAFVSQLDYSRLPEDVATVLQTLVPLERRISRQDRSAHYILRILPYREPHGLVSGVLVSFIDITSIVQAETALLDADLRKDVFLATLSHELRNPLAPIRTAAHLLQSPHLKHTDLARAQGIIARQVTHMSSLLDDLLDVSRITRGSFVLKRERIDIKVVIESAVEAVQPAIEAKGHTLRLQIPEVPVVLNADPVRLTQIMTNLLTNAVKYTPSGGLITAGGHIESGEAVLFVKDNGVGLTSTSQIDIFNMFTRVAGNQHSEGGLGIGLALAKGLVELHGGRIAVRSEGLGRGSEFIVILPGSLILDAGPLTMTPHGSAAPSAVRRILIADDNRDGADTLRMYFESAGHEVHLAYSGAEALEAAQRTRPQVAIIDIGMPELNGYEVAERLRLEPWGHGILLIALTGWGQQDDKARATAAGFDHHCTKPVNPADLERLVTTNSVE